MLKLNHQADNRNLNQQSRSASQNRPYFFGIASLLIVALIIWQPWKLSANPTASVNDETILPNMVSIAGGEFTKKDKFDGVNIFPYLTNEIESHPHETLMWRFTISAGMRKGNWKLVRLPDRMPMLFNLDKDPSEQNNVTQENLHLVKSMLRELGDWDVSTPHILFLEGEQWRRNQLDLYDKNYQLEQPKN